MQLKVRQAYEYNIYTDIIMYTQVHTDSSLMYKCSSKNINKKFVVQHLKLKKQLRVYFQLNVITGQ